MTSPMKWVGSGRGATDEQAAFSFTKTKQSDSGSDEVGFYCGEGPPVPFPNTEVKLTCADNTRLETAREDMAKPTQTENTLSIR